MLDETGSQSQLADGDSAFDILQDLERQTDDRCRVNRSHERLALKAKVIVQPGNTSDLLKLKVQGVTGDISEGGCRAMLPLPITVGDIYRLQFDCPEYEFPLVFARCVRCRLIREEAFEIGLKFLTPLKLWEAAKSEDSRPLV